MVIMVTISIDRQYYR